MGGAASRVGRGPQLVTGQDATARGRSGASTGVRGGRGADGLGSQDRPRGRTCGCSCPNARRTRSGRQATPPGPGPGSAGRRCQQTGFPMAPAPTPRARVHHHPEPRRAGSVPDKTCLQGPCLPGMGRPTRGAARRQDWRQMRLAKWLQRTGEGGGTPWVGPTARPRVLLCGPGDKDLERGARRRRPTPRPDPQGGRCLHQLPMSEWEPSPRAGGSGWGSSW